jgi:nitrogen regulatory protein P-II 2
METSTLKLLTIIADEALTKVIEETLLELGATGYTISHVEGMGRSGPRNSTWEGENIKFEVITTDEVLEKVLNYIKQNLFERYSIIVYYNDVHVIRTSHFRH